MSEKALNHKCIICGEMYHACDNCDKVKTYVPWRRICDSFEHYQVYMLIRTYQEKLDTVENIQRDLRNIGVKEGSYDNWADGTKKILDEIFAQGKKKSQKKQIPVETADCLVDEVVE